MQNVAAWTKAGVMIRETLSPARRRRSCSCRPAKGSRFSDVTPPAAPASARLAPPRRRRTGSGSIAPGTRLTAYESIDGATWTLVGTDTIPMAATVYVGIAVSSHTTAAAATATFDHVSVTP